MKKIISSSLKVTISYLAAVFLFSFFLIAPLSMKDNQYMWLSVLSFVVFMFLWSYMGQQMSKLGTYENKDMVEIKAYPFKGFVYGLIGFSPFLLIEIIYFIVYQPNSISLRFFHGIVRCLFGPMYFIIRGLHYTWYSYLIASVAVPIIAFVGYIIGYYDISITNIKNKKENEDFLND